MCTPRLSGLTAIIAGVLLSASVSTVLAKQTPEQKCQKGRYDAAAKYASCHQKVLGKFFAGSYTDYTRKFLPALSKCRVTYTDTWGKLQKKASGTGSTCDNPRYDTTSAPGTVIDRLTGLQWETKTDDATINDKDNFYSWSAGAPYTEADGTAFTTFLSASNSGVCHAGHCDWRLPAFAELETILLEPYPCTTRPCIDQAAFGPTVASGYWSATTGAGSPGYAWLVGFDDGGVGFGGKSLTIGVRAVRAGL